MAAKAPHAPVCLLSLDGGGIKGISELLILQHIMVGVQGQLGLTEEPLTCDYFDLIGGTSTGGLITIMLARLRMTASEALRQYFELAGKIFSKKNTKLKGKEGAFKASTLEESVKKNVSDQAKKIKNSERMLPTGENKTRAKGFVCAMTAEMMRKPYHLRTYTVSGEIVYDCEIWEAARATTAAPTYFKAISIKWPNGSSNRFVDAGLGFNNPTEEVIEESETVFGASTPLRILVSIGCGVKSSIRYKAPSGFDKFLPLNVINTIKDIAVDCEKTAENVERYFKHHSNVYFRFNIPEIGDIGMSEVDESTFDRISASTKDFFNVGSAGHNMLTPVVKILCEGAGNSVGVTHGITLGKNLTLGVPPVRGNHNIPFPRNTNFVGRESYIEQLMAQADLQGTANTCPWIALDGLGGVGKTQIALQFAYQIQETLPECSVFWVQASDALSFDTSYREIARKLGIPILDEADIKQRVLVALKDLSSPWLLIIDNADNYKALTIEDEGDGSRAPIDYLPRDGSGAVLFTTRDNKAATRFAEEKVTHIKEMSRSESKELLINSVQVGKRNLLNDETDITELLDLLLDLPLAIKQAAAYINENSTPVSKYISFFHENEKEVIEILSENFGDRRRYRNQQNPVAITWLISFEQIKRQDPLAAEYLSFIGVIMREDIPISLLPVGDSLNKQSKAIGTLEVYSFITQRTGEKAFDIHRLVHLATRNWLRRANELSLWIVKALNRLIEVIPYGGHINREIWTRYLPHGMYLINSIQANSDDETALIDLIARIWRCQYSIGQYVVSEMMHQQTLQLIKKVLGPEHPDTLTSMNNLASLLNSQGKYNEAEPIYHQTLQLREKVLGPEHPNTLSSMNNLATCLQIQGNVHESRSFFSDAT